MVFGFSMMSFGVARIPASGLRVMRPAFCSSSRARPPLVASLGITTLAPCGWAEKAARAANAAISFFIVKLLVGCVRRPAGNRYPAVLCAPWGTLFSGKVHHQLVADGL